MSDTTTARKAIGASRGIVLGTILGAPIILAWSWFLAALVITLIFAPWLAGVRPDLGWGTWLVAFGYAVLLFGSVLIHELAHGVAGRVRGQRIASIELNIWGGVTRFEPRIEEDSAQAARTSFIVSILGPIANLVLAGAGWLLLQLTEPWSVAWLLLLALTIANAALGIINLLPGIPLDGGWALQALLWRATSSQYTGTIIASWVGRLIAVAFIGWAVLAPLLAGNRPDIVTVAWMSALAIMLWLSANEAATHAKRARRMETYDLSRVIQPAIAASPDAEIGATLAYADANRAPGAPGRPTPAPLVVVLDESGLPFGLLDRRAALQAAEGSDGRTIVKDHARPLGPWIGVPEDITAPHLLESLTHRPKAQFSLVMRGSTLTGIIDLQEFFDELLAT